MKQIKVCIVALLIVFLLSACNSEQSENSNHGFAEQYKDYGGIVNRNKAGGIRNVMECTRGLVRRGAK